MTMQSFGTVQAHGTATEINQNASEDLVYNLSCVPSWMIVPYVAGGLYDRVQENFSKYKHEELLINQEYHRWFRRPSTQHINFNLNTRVRLLKPEAKKAKTYTEIRKPENLEMLDMVIYDSASDLSISAITWVTSSNIIKPMKIFGHIWEKVKNNRDANMFKCSNCGMIGRGKFYTANHMRVKSAICPDKLLTCEEKIIEDIVV